MYSIGQLSIRTGVKIPTIRYYEKMRLLESPERTSGNQRRYSAAELERLSFIKHARDLGFRIASIAALIDLQNHPDRSCETANKIAKAQLVSVTAKIKKLSALQTELSRIVSLCDEEGKSQDCHVLASLSDHENCDSEH